MLYLEDYLEMIEHLPQELRDRFTEMREMDLSVQNNMDSLETRVRIFFSQCRRNELQGVVADVEFQAIRKEYAKVLEDADEKVHISNAMYELVERYLHKLDEELHKFKCELEADNKGITEILEKRSIELDAASGSGAQKENRYFGAISSSLGHNKVDGRFKHKPEKRRDSTSLSYAPPEKRPSLSTPLSTPSRTVAPPITAHTLISSSTPTSTLPYNLSHLGANNAIAAAASQAIVATTQMPQGRRTASLKASMEAISQSGGHGAQELVIGRELAGATQNVIQAVERESLSSHRKKKKLGPTMSLGGSLGGLNTMPSVAMSNPEPDIPAVVINENGMVVEQTPDGEFTYDPNEPRYCICNHVSYGDMVACDNEGCPYEWFHYGCVGITSSPKGKWYCPQCTSTMRRRGGSRKT